MSRYFFALGARYATLHECTDTSPGIMFASAGEAARLTPERLGFPAQATKNCVADFEARLSPTVDVLLQISAAFGVSWPKLGSRFALGPSMRNESTASHARTVAGASTRQPRPTILL